MIEELDYQKTPIGELILRRRRSPSVPDEPVYEVKLNDQMLMSSSVNASERALATLALERLGPGPCDVLIGGLGLGYTAAAALEYSQVRRVDVVELLGPVIGWHRNKLVPAAHQLIDDPRCSLIEGDFFKYAAGAGPTTQDAGRSAGYDLILVDIDHSPDCWLHTRHAPFYTEPGLARLAARLNAGGTFGLWSASEPSAEFLALLRQVFGGECSHEVRFYNPHIGEHDTNWVILAGGGTVKAKSPPNAGSM